MTHVEALRGTVTALHSEILARRYYECFNRRDFDHGERYIDPQAVFTYPESPQQFIGRPGYRELARRWISAFPDGSVSIVSLRVVDLSTVRIEWVAHGTHLGVLALPGMRPVPPTGFHTHIPLRETIRVVNGLIVESEMEFDPDDLQHRVSA